MQQDSFLPPPPQPSTASQLQKLEADRDAKRDHAPLDVGLFDAQLDLVDAIKATEKRT